jgi:hypothetical protein
MAKNSLAGAGHAVRGLRRIVAARKASMKENSWFENERANEPSDVVLGRHLKDRSWR